MDFDAALELIDGITGADVELGEATPTYPDFPLDEYRRRYARLTALMEDQGLDALLLTQEENVRYLSGYNSVIWAVGRWLPGALLAPRNPADAVLMPAAFDVGAAGGTSWVATVDGLDDAGGLGDKVLGHLDRLGLGDGMIGVEAGPGTVMQLPHPAVGKLMDRIGDRTVDCSGVMSTLRMLKSDRELDRVRTIVTATTTGYRAALESAKVGMTEKEFVSILASAMYANGATAGTRPLFLNCVAGPDRYPLVDTVASDRPFQEGDIVFIDGGGGTDGYMSDIIRLVAIGEPSERQLHLAEVADRATRETLARIQPGVTASEVFAAGMEVYEDEGLEEYAGGLSGHGIGMEIWERPFIRDHGDDVVEDIHLRPGMTCCIEPLLLPTDGTGTLEGIYVTEQQVLVTEDGCEVLSGDLPSHLWQSS